MILGVPKDTLTVGFPFAMSSSASECHPIEFPPVLYRFTTAKFKIHPYLFSSIFLSWWSSGSHFRPGWSVPAYQYDSPLSEKWAARRLPSLLYPLNFCSLSTCSANVPGTACGWCITEIWSPLRVSSHLTSFFSSSSSISIFSSSCWFLFFSIFSFSLLSCLLLSIFACFFHGLSRFPCPLSRCWNGSDGCCRTLLPSPSLV